MTNNNSPEFTIALIRTPFLPPRYASFYVPLSFNKLDMRDYLQRLYGVDVIGVRSYIEQQKITRERPMGKYGYGRIRRPESKKRMTVEMAQPFVWPETPKDTAPYVFLRLVFTVFYLFFFFFFLFVVLLCVVCCVLCVVCCA